MGRVFVGDAMKMPFIDNEEKPWITVDFQFAGDAFGSGSISVTSDGAGSFVEIKADGPIRLDAKDIKHLAEWAEEWCRELNDWNGEK